jgi:hypothetical protein
MPSSLSSMAAARATDRASVAGYSGSSSTSSGGGSGNGSMAAARAADRSSVSGYAGSARGAEKSDNGTSRPAVTVSLSSTAAARAADRGSVTGYSADGRPTGEAKKAKTAAPAPTHRASEDASLQALKAYAAGSHSRLTGRDKAGVDAVFAPLQRDAKAKGYDPERLELLRDAAMVDWGSLPPSAKAERLAKLHGRATALTTHTPVGFNPSTGQPYADRGQRQVVDASHDELHRTIEDTASGIRASAETIARIATPGENLKGLAAGVVLGGKAALGIKKAAEAAASPSGPPIKPFDEKRTTKMLQNRPGHVPDTPRNRALLESVASDPSARAGTDANGTVWSDRMLPDGKQVWVGVRDGKVSYGGVNSAPLTFNPQNGYAAPSRPGKKK